MPRKGKYLFQRPGSQNWWLRLQFSGNLAKRMGKKKLEKSLGTPDFAEAEIRAAPEIMAHKIRLLWEKNNKDGSLMSRMIPAYEPGREYIQNDGTRIVATEEALIFLDVDGKVIKTEKPGSRFTVKVKADLNDVRFIEKVIGKNAHGDDAVIQTWAEHRGKQDYIAKEAWFVWELFKKITKNKPLAKCTREDGRALARKLMDSGNKSKTVAKKLSHLRAAVNLAIDEGKLSFNPFSNVVPNANDAKERLPFTEEDMRIVRENLHRLSEQDKLVWIWLATTGMRLSECFEATEEFKEAGIRYIRIGTKSDASYRPVPIPEAVLPLLPHKITGHTFTDTAKNVGKRLNRFLDKLGVDDRKSVHSLRHRAKSRLSAIGCPEGVQYKLLGHSDKNVGQRYLHVGIEERKAWLDKLGY